MENPVQDTEIQPREEGKQEAKREFIELIKLVVIFLLVFWGVKSFIIEGYEVQGESMTPALEDRDRILVFKLPHKLSSLSLFSSIQAFDDTDIIVFEGVGNKRFVKRVIAHSPRLTGNTVDAQHLEETDSKKNLVKVEFDRGAVRVNNWQIDETAYLPEEARTMRGKDACMLQPGEYYVLGDHRQVSKDSRSFSAIADEQIIGKAVVRFWPLNRFKVL
ncbi:MAG: signal peptidase I [Candidatus Hydrogenedentes bacterium]|nr:signal peptidase I [Candidatus Hydrogenedentota bacterium]